VKGILDHVAGTVASGRGHSRRSFLIPFRKHRPGSLFQDPDIGAPMVEIHRLTSNDGSRFREIRLKSLRDAPDAFGSTYEETTARPFESWPEQLANLPTFVAVVAGEDVGVVRGGPDGERADTVWLMSMWVAPSARGQGVGDALVDAVIDWAREGRFSRVTLDVSDDNRHAIALYHRKGFLPTGERGSLPPPRAHIGEHRCVLMLS